MERTGISGGHLGERNQLVRLGILARNIERPAGKPESTLVHRLAHEILHALQFNGRRRAVITTHHGAANPVVPDRRDHVDSGSVLLDRAE